MTAPLTPEQEALADAVADRVVERLQGPVGGAALITAEQAARLLGVSRDFIYENAKSLGAVRLGEGPKARLRFDPDRIREWVAAPEQQSPRPLPRAPRRRRRTRPDLELLPIRGRATNPQTDQEDDE